MYFAILKEKACELAEWNGKIFELMTEYEIIEQAMDAEVLNTDDYRAKYQRVKIDVARVVEPAHQRGD